MRMGPAVLASVLVCGFATTAFARDANNIINRIEGVIRSAVAKATEREWVGRSPVAKPAERERIGRSTVVRERVDRSVVAKAAEREWNALPQKELACTTQKLAERGDNVQSLARRGIFPSDFRVAEVRTACSTAKAVQSPGQPAQSSNVLNALAPRSPSRGEASVFAQAVPQPLQQRPPSEEKINQLELLSELKHKIEKLQTDLAFSSSRITELERAKAAAELELKQVELAKLDAENTNGEIQRARIADRTELETVIARLKADKAAADARNNWRESLAYAGIAGLLAILLALIGSLFADRQNERVSKQRAADAELTTKVTFAQFQRREQEGMKTSSQNSSLCGSEVPLLPAVGHHSTPTDLARPA